MSSSAFVSCRLLVTFHLLTFVISCTSSEDCLYLDVYVPPRSDHPRPCFVHHQAFALSAARRATPACARSCSGYDFIVLASLLRDPIFSGFVSHFFASRSTAVDTPSATTGEQYRRSALSCSRPSHLTLLVITCREFGLYDAQNLVKARNFIGISHRHLRCNWLQPYRLPPRIQLWRPTTGSARSASWPWTS